MRTNPLGPDLYARDDRHSQGPEVDLATLDGAVLDFGHIPRPHVAVPHLSAGELAGGHGSRILGLCPRQQLFQVRLRELRTQHRSVQQCREVVQSAQSFGVRRGPILEVAEQPPCEEHGVIRSARESIPAEVREQAAYDLLKPVASARPRDRHLVHPQTIGVGNHRGQ
ncbi:hypothetical protein [Streptomyces olivochromogenes]|uniref:hypothetical protein n=1 Tax=Streptomyces olivochromogenes TaxID=1963 RepID=UPI000D14CC3E|nr:hypothetical protein [Streptomyces olivochromogenes]